jgi:signal transduction histidine kinase
MHALCVRTFDSGLRPRGNEANVGGAVTETDETRTGHGRRTELLTTGVLDHQLKTDATVVHGWATTLDEGWDRLTDEQKRDAVRIIRRRSAAIAEVARSGLTEVARSWPDGDPDVDPRAPRGDLAERIRQVTHDMHGSARGHVVHYDGPSSLPLPDAVDIVAVERAVQELIENATKYSVDGSEIVVVVRGGSGNVTIDVVDQGVGIPAEGDLFDPFVRHDHGETADGSGLGLYMVRSAIESSGGRVSAKRNRQWGSTFHIELPA